MGSDHNSSHGLRRTERLLKRASQLSTPSRDIKNRIKSRLIQHIERMPRPTLMQRFFLEIAMFRKVLAGTVAVCLFLLALNIHPTSVPETSASGLSLRIIYGGAALSFGDTLRKAEDFDAVTAGDTLITGKDSFVELHIFGHSVVRLGDSSTVTIADIDPAQKVTLDVDGRVWVKTLTSDNHLKLRTADGVAVSVPNGAASIESNKRFTRIITKENIALVEVKNTFQEDIKSRNLKVIKDHVVYIPSPRTTAGIPVQPDAHLRQEIVAKVTTADTLQASQWVQENEIKDREYREHFESQKKQDIAREAGVLPDSPLYLAKKISERATLNMANEDDRARVRLENAEKRALEAFSLFEKEHTSGAERAFGDYKSAIEALQQEMSIIYGPRSDELKEALQAHLAAVKAKLSQAASPDRPTYEVITFVEQKLLALTDEKLRAEQKDTLAQRKLYEILELLSKNDPDNVQKYFGEYEDITRESIDVAMKFARQGEPEAAQKILLQKSELELPLLGILAQDPLLKERAESLQQYAIDNLNVLSDDLAIPVQPAASVSGTAVKSNDGDALIEAEISEDEDPEAMI